MSALPSQRDKHVERILREVDRLPTLSPIATRLIHAGAGGEVDLDEIVMLIESDPALSATMLKLCRSAEKGLADRITSVRRAVVMLGQETVRSVALGVEVIGVLSRQSPHHDIETGTRHGFDAHGFWTHSIAVACAAEMLARLHEREGAKGESIKPDQAFLGGLLHGLGRLVLHLIVPEAYEKIIDASQRKRLPSASVERTILGLDHHTAGRRLSQSWGLPEFVRDTIWFCDQPIAGVPMSSDRSLIALVTLARSLCRAQHLGWSGDFHPAGSSQTELELLGLSCERVESVVPELVEEVARRSSILGLGEQTTPELLLKALSDANRTLAGLNRAMSEQSKRAQRAGEIAQVAGELLDATSGPCCFAVALGATIGALGKVLDIRNCAATFRIGEYGVWRTAQHDADGSITEIREVSQAPVGRDVFWLVDREDLLVCVHGAGDWMDMAARVDLSPLREACVHVLLAAVRLDASQDLEDALAQANRSLAEMQAELTEKASMARLGELASGAAHEMNNPLAVIRGRAQLLRSSLDPAGLVSDVEAIENAAVSLSALITELHELAMPEPSRSEVSDVAGVVEHAIEHVRARVPGEHRILIEGVEHAVGVVQDRELAAMALAELLVNAVQAGPDKEVRIEAHFDAADSRIYLRVRDCGRGMSERAMDHAFDPFFSEHPAGRQRGMGLARARRWIEHLGGRIRLEHNAGGGTLATIELPAAHQSAA